MKILKWYYRFFADQVNVGVFIDNQICGYLKFKKYDFELVRKCFPGVLYLEDNDPIPSTKTATTEDDLK